MIKKLIEKIIDFLEDLADRKIIAKTDFSKGENFDTVVKELKLKED